MAKSVMNLQDSFLNQVRKDNTEISLVMLDGSKLTGIVRGFDNFTVILQCEASQHLIYKHAIAQIVTRRNVAGGEIDRPRRSSGSRGGGRPANSGERPSREPREPSPKQKFNTLDLSSVQVDAEESKNQPPPAEPPDPAKSES